MNPRHPSASSPEGAAPWRHPAANATVWLQGQRVDCRFERSARRTIGLHVGPQGLSVRAPRQAPWPLVEAFVQRKARWVLHHLQRQASVPASVWPEPTEALLQQAWRDLQARVSHWAPRLGVQPRRVRLSNARTRWGSASSRGTISLNWRLVCLPEPLRDYVVVHELAHLHEMNHGPAFWAWVASVLPDHAERRAALRRHRLVVG